MKLPSTWQTQTLDWIDLFSDDNGILPDAGSDSRYNTLDQLERGHRPDLDAASGGFLVYASGLSGLDASGAVGFFGRNAFPTAFRRISLDRKSVV